MSLTHAFSFDCLRTVDGDNVSTTALGFDAIAVSTANNVVVPAGYSAKAFLPWGTPITGSYPEFWPDASNSGAEQQQVGMHHDGMHFFPIDFKAGGNRSDEGLLVMNHEYINQKALHPDQQLATHGREGECGQPQCRKSHGPHHSLE